MSNPATTPPQPSKMTPITSPANILTLPKEARTALLSGPKLNIIIDGNVLIRKKVPKCALLASSTKLYDLLQVRPNGVTQFRVSRKVEKGCVEHLLDLFTTEKILDVSAVKLSSGDDYIADVKMYQACLALGIHYTHTLPLLNALRAKITNHLLTFEEMNSIVERVRETDPLFKHLANSLCHRRFKKEIADIEAFEKWLDKPSKKTLQKAMVEIDQEHKKRREAHRVRVAASNEKFRRELREREEREMEEEE